MESSLITTADQLLATARQLLATSQDDQLQSQLDQLQPQTYQADFWNRADAQEVMQQLGVIRTQLSQINRVSRLSADLSALVELLAEEEVVTTDTQAELAKLTAALQTAVNTLELNQFLDGKYDSKGAMVSIHAGQGGTEAMDWAEMLRRMYTRYFEQQGWSHRLVTESRGEEAGIKSVEFEIDQPYAYGYLKREAGTHRLVRQSPFNADHLRQTSFALVEVLPLLDAASTEVDLKDQDLEWNFTRSGGAGGQSVNKVNTAVELTHLPTQIVVRCREERTQVQNRDRALKKLKAILAQRELDKQATELATVKGEHTHASWGTQIRNYVLHPYQLVKDTRTGYETSDTTGVLAGQIDDFIMAELRQL